MNNRLINFRHELKLSPIEMAGKLDVSKSFYEKIEHGDRNPSYNFITKFKSIFPSSDIDYIFFSNIPHETCASDLPTGTCN